ncbi:hypothetical protein BH10CYA1_BH10CYA1_47360 [soil metagenome]
MITDKTTVEFFDGTSSRKIELSERELTLVLDSVLFKAFEIYRNAKRRVDYKSNDRIVDRLNYPLR